MPEKRSKKKPKKRPYVKPMVTKVELEHDEAALTDCTGSSCPAL